MPLFSLHNFSYQITLKNVNVIFVKYENLTTLSIQVYCIPYYIHHYPHTHKIPFGIKLNAAKQNGNGKLVNILRTTQYFVSLSLRISLWPEFRVLTLCSESEHKAKPSSFGLLNFSSKYVNTSTLSHSSSREH